MIELAIGIGIGAALMAVVLVAVRHVVVYGDSDTAHGRRVW